MIHWRYSLRTKFTLLILALFIIIYGAVATLLLTMNTNDLREQLTSSVFGFAMLATKPLGETYNVYASSGTIQLTNKITSFAEFQPAITNVSIYDVSGNLLYTQRPTAIKLDVKDLNIIEPTTKYDKDKKLVAVVSPFVEDTGFHRYTFVYEISQSLIDQSILQTAQFTALLCLIGLIISAYVTYLSLSQLFLRPIKSISRAAVAISAGSYDTEVSIKNHDELGDLASAVDSMAKTLSTDITKLKEVDELKNEFIALASHNLRTPITLISGGLDSLSDEKLPPESKKGVAAIMRRGVNELNSLTTELISLIGLESGKIKLVRSDCDVREIIRNAINQLQPKAAVKNVKLEFNPTEEPIIINVDGPKLTIVLQSIIDNAIKFSHKNSEVRVSISQDISSVNIRISDQGVGIEPSEMPKLFQKFHRATSYMHYDYEGLGLSLNLAKLIANSHGGDIMFQSKLNVGTTCTIHLPSR